MSLSMIPLESDADKEKSLALSMQPLPGGVGLNASTGSAQLVDYIEIISRHWRFVLAATALGCLCGAFIALIQTPSYRAKSSLEIQNINGDFLNMKQARPVDEDQQGTDAMTELQTQIEVLQSDMLSQNAVSALKKGNELAKVRMAPPKLRVQAGERGAGMSESDVILDAVAKSVKVRSVGQTRIIQVQVDAPDPVLASDFANTLVTEYIHQNTKARWQAAEAAGEYTRGQLAETRKKLEEAELVLQKFASEHQLVFSPERQNISDTRLREVQTDLLHAKADLVDKQARAQVASTLGVDSVPDVLKDANLQQLRSKLIDLRRQEAELATIYKPDYSELKKVKAQIEELQSALDQERDRIANRISQEYNESSTRVSLLNTAYDQVMRQAVKESETAVQYDILKRDVDANLNDYQSMLARSKELNLAAAIQTSNIRVIDRAKPPTKPFAPKTPLNITLGLLSGFSLGVAFVFIRDRGNQNLRHPGEATVRLGLPELAVIGSADSSKGRLKTLSLRRVAVPVNGQIAKEGGDDFRSLLTSIFLSGVRGKEPKLVVVTSCAPQDGKTTVSSNLSIALARAGKRVLLVDGDLRKPQMHKIFNLDNEIGLGNLLQDCSKPAEAQRVIASTPISGLNVLTSGSYCTAPADLLFDPHLRVLLDSFRDQYDMVIVDSPPMMRIPDARLLGRNADAVVLVARANRTSRNSILMAQHRLALDHTRLLGVVLNDCDLSNEAYEYES